MQHLMFTIHDEKAGAYLPPFFLPNAEMAKRTFSDCINDKKHAFGQHPEDYTLFHLGAFDNITAETILIEQHSLGNGINFKTIQQPDIFNTTHELPDNFNETDYQNAANKYDGDQT